MSKTALLVDMSHDDTVDIDDGVYVFASREDAIEFAFETLVRSNEFAVNPDGSIWSPDRLERYSDDRSKALEEWQDNLGSMEYYHLRDVRDYAGKTVSA